MKRALALLLTVLLLSGAGCIPVSRRDARAENASRPAAAPETTAPASEPTPETTDTPEPTLAPTPEPTPESTPEPTPAPTEEPARELTRSALAGTWEMTRMMQGSAVVDIRGKEIESYLTFYNNGKALYYWHERSYTERYVLTYTIHGDAVILFDGQDSITVTYDGRNDDLSLPWKTSTQVYERRPGAAIPDIEPPAVESKTSDGLCGVWILTDVEAETEEYKEYALLLNSWIARGLYDFRYHFRSSLAATEYYYDGVQEYLSVFSYTVDWENGVIRSNNPVIRLSFTLEGDVLTISEGGLRMHFARYRKSDSV